jgi:hypothetical protein
VEIPSADSVRGTKAGRLIALCRLGSSTHGYFSSERSHLLHCFVKYCVRFHQQTKAVGKAEIWNVSDAKKKRREALASSSFLHKLQSESGTSICNPNRKTHTQTHCMFIDRSESDSYPKNPKP